MKWLRWQALIAALSTVACTGLCHGTEAETQSVRVKPKFRVLFNQDCTNFFDRGEHTKEAVQLMIDEVADGGADVFLVNPNAQLVNYPSKVWQTFWDGYKEGDRSFFGSIDDKGVARREHWVGQMAKLAEECDYLATALEGVLKLTD